MLFEFSCFFYLPDLGNELGTFYFSFILSHPTAEPQQFPELKYSLKGTGKELLFYSCLILATSYTVLSAKHIYRGRLCTIDFIIKSWSMNIDFSTFFEKKLPWWGQLNWALRIVIIIIISIANICARSTLNLKLGRS